MLDTAEYKTPPNITASRLLISCHSLNQFINQQRGKTEISSGGAVLLLVAVEIFRYAECMDLCLEEMVKIKVHPLQF